MLFLLYFATQAKPILGLFGDFKGAENGNVQNYNIFECLNCLRKHLEYVCIELNRKHLFISIKLLNVEI